MRRIALIIIAIAAIIACGLGSVQAEAASSGEQAAPSPAVLLGGRCVAVHSNVNARTGTICVYLVRRSGKVGGEVVFTSRSGPLRKVSAQIMRLTANQQAIQVLRNVSKTVTGAVMSVIPWNWWGEGMRRSFQASVFNACMIWTDGGKACTGSRWLSTSLVRV